MRKFLLISLIAVAAAMPAAAQQRLNLEFPGLEERASEVVDVTIDASMLRLATKFLSNKDEDERAVKQIVQGLQGIYVRSYTFDDDNEYDRSLIDRVKSQLGASWKPLVTVRSKTRDNVNIYADMRGENIVGLVVIAADPREFTVVNIVGPIDIEKLANLEGEFGIPRITRERDRD